MSSVAESNKMCPFLEGNVFIPCFPTVVNPTSTLHWYIYLFPVDASLGEYVELAEYPAFTAKQTPSPYLVTRGKEKGRYYEVFPPNFQHIRQTKLLFSTSTSFQRHSYFAGHTYYRLTLLFGTGGYIFKDLMWWWWSAHECKMTRTYL